MAPLQPKRKGLYTKKRAAVRYQLGIAKRLINTRRQTTHFYIAG
ncbi:hypothetical protein SFC43_00120 [Bacteroides sp. CR5/BHMF/2]|nr:hypothetical protein [Bacteroides sp. CR5/BHMF/2]